MLQPRAYTAHCALTNRCGTCHSLLPKAVTTTDVDLIFTKARRGGGQGMGSAWHPRLLEVVCPACATSAPRQARGALPSMAQVKAKGARKIAFDQFVLAVDAVAAKKVSCAGLGVHAPHGCTPHAHHHTAAVRASYTRSTRAAPCLQCLHDGWCSHRQGQSQPLRPAKAADGRTWLPIVCAHNAHAPPVTGLRL